MVSHGIDRQSLAEAVYRIERHVGASDGRVWGHVSKTPVAVRIKGTVLLLPDIGDADRKAVETLFELQSR